MTISDETHDFIYDQGETSQDLGVVDIIRVTISNDGENLKIAIETNERLPSFYSPITGGYYGLSILIKADYDDKKSIYCDIIVDESGWSLWSIRERGIQYERDQKTTTFIVPLDLEEWGEDPQVMGVWVRTGYEENQDPEYPGSSDVRIYDYVPNQGSTGFKYTNYKLWTEEPEEEGKEVTVNFGLEALVIIIVLVGVASTIIVYSRRKKALSAGDFAS